MTYVIDESLVDRARVVIASRDIFWVIGGAGSGKSTVCAQLAGRGLAVYDMDAHIYGSYHRRFDPSRHPANAAWSSAQSSLAARGAMPRAALLGIFAEGNVAETCSTPGTAAFRRLALDKNPGARRHDALHHGLLAFLLGMPWPEFSAFHESALAEYLDLLAEDLGDVSGPLVVDGGAWHPRLLARAMDPRRIVCLAAPGQSSEALWEGNEDRAQMKQWMESLPDPQAAWRTFLEFDAAITESVVAKAGSAGVAICSRSPGESVASFAQRVVTTLGIPTTRSCSRRP